MYDQVIVADENKNIENWQFGFFLASEVWTT